MINRFCQILLLMVFCGRSARTFLSSEQINADGHYYLFELLDHLPELHAGVMDASQEAVALNGRSSLLSPAVIVMYDSLYIGGFHDMSSWSSSRFFGNQALGGIEILTGINAANLCDRCEAIVNILPIRNGSGPALRIKGNLGQGIGDPAIYREILTETSPENQDQIAAVDGYAGLPFKGLLLGAGASYIDMHRFSNRYAARRSANYGSISSYHTLNEQAKAQIDLGVRFPRLEGTITTGFANSYSFKFHQFDKRYYLYDGDRLHAQSRLRLNTPKLAGSLRIGGFVDDAKVFVTHSDFGNSKISAASALLSLRYPLSQGNMSLLSRLSTEAIDQSDSMYSTVSYQHQTGYHPQSVAYAAVGFHSFGNLLNVVIGSTPSFETYGEKEFDEFGNLSWRYRSNLLLDMEQIQAAHSASLWWHRKIADSFAAQSGASLAYAPLWEIGHHQDSTYLVESSHQHWIWNFTAQASLPHLGKAVAGISPWFWKAGYAASVTWHGMRLSGALFYNGKTSWTQFNEPVKRFGHKQRVLSRNLNGYVCAEIKAFYHFFGERTTVSIHIKDIGKKHVELPHGNKVSPSVTVVGIVKI
ncbi:MAG: hypothetical protein GF398_15070 [Chitinivibrionales bacterium]|nr:hypothetical protein [Chitinivibrionales bacterium]